MRHNILVFIKLKVLVFNSLRLYQKLHLATYILCKIIDIYSFTVKTEKGSFLF
jgi:hypothetical protein